MNYLLTLIINLIIPEIHIYYPRNSHLFFKRTYMSKFTPFKSLKFYRLAGLPEFSEFKSNLETKLFLLLAEGQKSGSGFVPVKPEIYDDDLTIQVENYYFFKVKIEEKVLTNAMIKLEVEKRVADIEESTKEKLSKKDLGDIRIQVINELLPIALSQSVLVDAVIDSKAKLLYINTSSETRSDTVLSCLREAFNHELGIYRPETKLKACILMRKLLAGELESSFYTGSSCELKSADPDSPHIFRSNYLDLWSSDIDPVIKRLIEKQYEVSKLNLVRDPIDFVLDNKFCLSKIKFNQKTLFRDDEESSDWLEPDWYANSLLMMTELSELVDELIKDAGGWTHEDPAHYEFTKFCSGLFKDVAAQIMRDKTEYSYDQDESKTETPE